VLRLLIFFVGAITVIAPTVPYKTAGLNESPFVTVFSSIGIPYTAEVMNFVIITALLSAGNSGLYACARMIFSLADEGQDPAVFRRDPPRHSAVRHSAVRAELQHDRWPRLTAVQRCGSGIGIPGAGLHRRLRRRRSLDVYFCLSLLPSSSVCAQRWALRCAGLSGTVLPGPADAGLGLCLVSVIGLAFDPNQVAALYFGIPFVVLCYLDSYLRHGTSHTVSAPQTDVLTPSNDSCTAE
jgi:S-methylmethionine transporter